MEGVRVRGVGPKKKIHQPQPLKRRMIQHGLDPWFVCLPAERIAAKPRLTRLTPRAGSPLASHGQA